MIDGKKISFDFCDISIGSIRAKRDLMGACFRNGREFNLRGLRPEVKRLAIRAREGEITVENANEQVGTLQYNGGVFVQCYRHRF